MTHPIRARLLGLAATVAILTVLIGIPATLVAIGANPIPNRLPTLDQLTTALTTRDDGTLTLRVLTVAAWLAWAFLAATITLELVARLRGATAPHLPGLALPQSAARGLVGAAVLLFVAGPTLALPSMVAAPAAAAAPAWAAPATQTGQSTASARQATTPRHDTTTPPVEGVDSTGTHTVTRGESLWSIAATELGDGHRWRELADLNPGTHGPDWVIHPGTVLTLPASATAATQPPKNGQRYTVEAGDTLSQIAHDHLGDADRYPDIVEASRHVRQPDGRHLRDPDLIYPGWHLTIPDTTATTQGTSTPERTPLATPPNGAPAAAVPGTPGTGSKPADPGRSSSAAPSSGAASGNGSATPTPSTSDATTPAPAPAVDPSHAATTTSPDDSAQTPAPWLLAGLAGGPVLAGSMWILLRQRRAMQVRHRRPGRTVATPPPILAPVEKTLATAGSTTQPAVEFVDAVLRHLASGRAHAGLPMPAVAAVELGRHGLTLHLHAPAQLAPPWTHLGNQTRWSLPSGTDPEVLGDLIPDQVAPYPLLVTIGTSDTGNVWLLNCEDLTITLTGDPTYRDDFARYLTAEVACNPWSWAVTLNCVGVATQAAGLNPDRIRPHTGATDPAARILADAVNTIDRAHDHNDDVATARAHGAGDDSWAPSMLVLDGSAQPTPALTQLLALIDAHPGSTGTSVVLVGADTTPAGGVVVELTATGRARLPHAGLDLVAVGLTSDEAQGCAALIAASTDYDDTPMPVDDSATTGWRSYTDAAGALRPQHTVPRQTPDKDILVPTTTLLPDPDEHYVAHAATTPDDLAALAPKVPTTVRDALHDADPTLDDDVAAWFADECPLPRLTLLGPVRARTRGTPLAVRKAYMTGVLTYLSTRPFGATPDELADALGLTASKARGYAKTVRDWLGTNPRTGQPHLPDARRTPEAISRGVAIYQVQDLLVDADLFRRLRARGQARGQDGLADLTQALDLVQGPPFSQLSGDAWAWLYEGDRLDHHLTCAVVDVAHTVTTHALRTGDTRTARTATETALLAAPAEEIPHLDLAAVTHAEGHPDQANRILRDQVANRTDDEGPPLDLSLRSHTILENPGWTGHERTGDQSAIPAAPELVSPRRVAPRTGST
jgi:nucleoid-associated protein YgaU